MKMKEETEKAGLTLTIPKTKIMVSCPIHFVANGWGNDGNGDRIYLFICLFVCFGGQGAPKSLQMVIAARKIKTFVP